MKKGILTLAVMVLSILTIYAPPKNQKITRLDFKFSERALRKISLDKENGENHESIIINNTLYYDFNDYLYVEFPDYYRLALKESARCKDSIPNWRIINKFDCVGAFQIKYKYLRSLGFNFSLDELRADPDMFTPQMQFDAIRELHRRNRMYLRQYYNYLNKKVKKITITETGIIFASHLAGRVGVEKFLKTWGKHDPSDSYGTRLSDYLNYDKTFRDLPD